MKFTLSWLKDHLDTNADLKQLGDMLTMIGLEVESITDRSAALQAFTVAKILSAERHPEADKLQVCKVLSDVGELQIVCGAPNAHAGLHVALAKEGADIPGNGMVIKKTKIRGVESNGMLCSAEELALGGASEGIIELPETTQIGQSVADALGLNDPVIDIAVTPNRADCLSVRGVARDLAAAGLGMLKPLPGFPDSKGAFASPITVNINDTQACPQFIGVTIKGLHNAASPDWLRKRLEAIGQRSISALVDITNYMTFDLGRPLHVYDTAKLHGNLTVRAARAGESLKALNGKDYTLQTGMTVIADDSGALAIGGIIGGEPSGCTETTTEAFLEVALFDPIAVAKTGRILGIDSDARYRFERGLDVDFVESGALLALKMIQELCGGSCSELTYAGRTPEWQRSFYLRAEHIRSLGGISLSNERVEAILKALGFTCMASGNGWAVSPPSWRRDIEGEADLIEELLRINGYDQIPSTPLPKLPGISHSAWNLAQTRVHLAKRTLAARGMLEAYSWSFLAKKQAALFGDVNPALKLLNPISADLDTMRPNLLPNLLEAAVKNGFRGFKNINLFEVGLQFSDITPTGQRMVAAGLRSGRKTQYNYKDSVFTQAERNVDTFDVKADAVALLQALGLVKYEITTAIPAWYHPGRSGALTLGGKIVLGYFGEMHPAIITAFGLEQSAVAFEIFLDAIPAPRSKNKARSPLVLSDYQAVERDFAFIVDAAVTSADITKALVQVDKQLITDIAIFDVYTGTGVETGKKSVAVKVTLQAADRTLSESDIASVSAAIVAAAVKGFAGQLRQ